MGTWLYHLLYYFNASYLTLIELKLGLILDFACLASLSFSITYLVTICSFICDQVRWQKNFWRECSDDKWLCLFAFNLYPKWGASGNWDFSESLTWRIKELFINISISLMTYCKNSELCFSLLPIHHERTEWILALCSIDCWLSSLYPIWPYGIKAIFSSFLHNESDCTTMYWPMSCNGR